MKSHFVERSPALPAHAHARDHLLLLALQRYKATSPLKLVEAQRASAEIAAERIREFAWDLGAELYHHRWVSAVARKMGVKPESLRPVVQGKRLRVSSDLVDKVSRATGIPVAVFYAEEP